MEKFNQNPWKIPQKKFIFSKAAGSKNEFIQMYFSRLFAITLSNFIHDFCEDIFHRPKL